MQGLEKIRRLSSASIKSQIEDKSRIYNTNLIRTLETENMLELAEVLLSAAVARRGIARRPRTHGLSGAR